MLVLFVFLAKVAALDQRPTSNMPFDQPFAGKLVIGIHDGGAVNPQFACQSTFRGQTYPFSQLARKNRFAQPLADLAIQRHAIGALQLN